ADLLAGDGIALVRHCGRSFLPLTERLLGFADFRALEMSDFESYLFERSCNQRQGGHVRGMTVTRDHLRGDVGRAQVPALADARLGGWSDVPEGSHGARDFADPQVLPGRCETKSIAPKLIKPKRDLQSKGDRLGMDTMRAPDLDGILELERPGLQDGEKALDIIRQEFGCLLQE